MRRNGAIACVLVFLLGDFGKRLQFSENRDIINPGGENTYVKF